MSANLEMVLAKVGELNNDELLLVLQRVTEELRHTAIKNGPAGINNSPTRPVMYRLTPEEASATLAEIFTEAELAEIAAADVSNLSFGDKSLSQTVIEDREDRV